MGTYNHEDFVFTALANFRANKDPEAQLDSAKEFGIRIVYNNGIKESDYNVVASRTASYFSLWSIR